jgi:hypothetical protein
MRPFEYVRADDVAAAVALVSADSGADYLAEGTTQLDLISKDGVIAPDRRHRSRRLIPRPASRGTAPKRPDTRERPTGRTARSGPVGGTTATLLLAQVRGPS